MNEYRSRSSLSLCLLSLSQFKAGLAARQAPASSCRRLQGWSGVDGVATAHHALGAAAALPRCSTGNWFGCNAFASAGLHTGYFSALGGHAFSVSTTVATTTNSTLPGFTHTFHTGTVSSATHTAGRRRRAHRSRNYDLWWQLGAARQHPGQQPNNNLQESDDQVRLRSLVYDP